MSRSESHQPRPTLGNRPGPAWAWVVVLAALAVSAVFIVQAVQAPWSGIQGKTTSEDATDENSATGTGTSLPGTTVPTSTSNPASAAAYIDHVASEQAAIALAEVTRIIRQGEQAQEDVTRAGRDVAWWQQQSDAIQTNDLGRRLAADPEQVHAFAMLRDAVDPSAGVADVSALADEIEALLTPLRRAREEPGSTYRPGDSLRESIDTVGRRAKLLADSWSDRRAELQALITSASTLPPSSTTLLEALNQSSQQAAKERIARIVAAEEAARDAATSEMASLRARLASERAVADRKLAEAEANLARAEIEEAALSKRASAEALSAQSQLERERNAGEARLEALATKAESPEIKQIFAPLINPGLFQPSPPRRERGREARPMSFGELARSGSLEPTDEGLRDLMEAVNQRHNRERGSWVEPTAAEDWAELRRRQALLRELGPTMVELGLLSP
ncbi:MAG: hypothetical protein AAF662_04360 [Pseudomonadota bacterium]